MSEPWRRLADHWKAAGLTIRPGVGLSSLDAFEAKYGVVLPEDLRAYWGTVDGMEDELDPGVNRFWPLELVKPVSEELSDIHGDRWAYPDCYVFADHCVWCFAWAVRLDRQKTKRSGPVFQVTGSDQPGRLVADSFTDFVEMYLANEASIL